MAINQANLFIIFSFIGIIIGFLFDIFRILRKTIRTKDIITYIEDIIFWILTGIIIIYGMYKFCDGELRFFMVLGIGIGACIYMISISQYIIKTGLIIVDIIKRVIIYPFKKILKLLKKLLFRPILVICINFKKIFSDFVKKIRKDGGIFSKKGEI